MLKKSLVPSKVQKKNRYKVIGQERPLSSTNLVAPTSASSNLRSTGHYYKSYAN